MGMHKGLLLIGLAMVSLGRVHAAQVPGDEEGFVPEITLRIYNYGRATSEVLDKSEHQFKSILTQGGIGTAWLNCFLTAVDSQRSPCSQPVGSSDVQVVLLSPSKSAHFAVPSESLGFALAYSRLQRVNTVYILYGHVEQLARERRISAGQVLGAAMAHEIGHLFLGAEAHALGGIMQPHWEIKELNLVSQDSLLFLPGEVKRIRAELLFRARAHGFHQPQLMSITDPGRNLAGVPGR